LGFLEDLGTPNGTALYEMTDDGNAIGFRRGKSVVGYSPSESPALRVLVSKKKLSRLFAEPGARVRRTRIRGQGGVRGISSKGDVLAEAEAVVDGNRRRRIFLYLQDGTLLDVAKAIAGAEWDWTLSGEARPKTRAKEMPSVQLLQLFYGPNKQGEIAWLTRIDGFDLRVLLFSP
jgi:hypothetical protein